MRRRLESLATFACGVGLVLFGLLLLHGWLGWESPGVDQLLEGLR